MASGSNVSNGIFLSAAVVFGLAVLLVATWMSGFALHIGGGLIHLTLVLAFLCVLLAVTLLVVGVIVKLSQ